MTTQQEIESWLCGNTQGILTSVRSAPNRFAPIRCAITARLASWLGVNTLRASVSEASVRAAAGWSGGAMVSRYAHALSGELAIDEFNRAWQIQR